MTTRNIFSVSIITPRVSPNLSSFILGKIGVTDSPDNDEKMVRDHEEITTDSDQVIVKELVPLSRERKPLSK